MKKAKKLLLLVLALTFVMSITAFAGQDSQEAKAFVVSEEDINPNSIRSPIAVTHYAIDKDGNTREIANPLTRAFGDWAVVTHVFYDRGYDASADSHFYEVMMNAELIVSDEVFSKCVFSVKPKGNDKYIDSITHPQNVRFAADSIYYGYPGQGPSSPSVYAKEALYLYGDSIPLTSPVDYMRRPIKG